jgi:hypothetical protein
LRKRSISIARRELAAALARYAGRITLCPPAANKRRPSEPRAEKRCREA